MAFAAFALEIYTLLSLCIPLNLHLVRHINRYYIIVAMDIEYVKQTNFQYRELLVDRLGKINKKQCYLDLFKYLHKTVFHIL